MPAARFLRHHALLSTLVLIASGVAGAEAGQSTGTLAGTVTARGGTIVLPGADVLVLDADGRQMSATTSGEQGRFQVAGLPVGRYSVEATLDGFTRKEVPVDVGGSRTTEVGLDLELAPFVQTVTVTRGPIASLFENQFFTTPQSIDGRTIDEVDGIQDALRLMAGVSLTPAGLSIRGGRPTQSGLLLGNADVTDPSSGSGPFRLPADAIASIDVFPNPNAVEFGRFSSGIAVLGTRQGEDAWRGRVGNFMPSVRTERARPLNILGVERFGPRLMAGGPLVKHRTFLAQSAEYRYEALSLWTRPETDVRSGRALNTFSRIDTKIADGHLLTGSLTLLANNASSVNMNSFTAPEVAADMRERAANIVVSDKVVLSTSSSLDSVLQANRYVGSAFPKADNRLGFEIAPEANAGQYFHTSRRDTVSWQWLETLSKFSKSRAGDHLVKVGIDLLHAQLNGSTLSAPVTVRRLDGTMARRLTFSGPATQSQSGTDVAVFAQDRWQVARRLRVEGGGRMDRDGTLERLNGSVRLGGVLSLAAADTRVVRGGWGQFYERTPLVVGAFRQMDAATDVRFGQDGLRALGPPMLLVPRVADGLVTPSSHIWNIGLEQQMSHRVSVSANYLDRRSRDEFVVRPESTTRGSAHVLSSEGHSVYRDLEVSTSYAPGDVLQIRASYTRSTTRTDANAYLSLFDLLRAPVIPANIFSTADIDVPNRFVARVRYAPTRRWLVAPVIEFRSGVPYTVVDEYLDVVPSLGRPRFPHATIVDLRVDRLVKVFKWQPWLGVRVSNALNTFDPTEVQRNLTSPRFGGFSGGRPRQVRLQIRFD